MQRGSSSDEVRGASHATSTGQPATMTTETKTCDCKCKHTFTWLGAVVDLDNNQQRFDDDGFTVPDAPGVYRWHDDDEYSDNGTVYIGMSSNLRRRINQHIKLGGSNSFTAHVDAWELRDVDTFKSRVSVSFVQTPTVSIAELLERQFLSSFAHWAKLEDCDCGAFDDDHDDGCEVAYVNDNAFLPKYNSRAY